jgi:hypothetical protein
MKISNALLQTIALAIGLGTIVACTPQKKLTKNPQTLKTEKTETGKTETEKTETESEKKEPFYCAGCGMG